MFLLALSVSCLAQLPGMTVTPPLTQPPANLPLLSGRPPFVRGQPAAVWLGSEYLMAWRDQRRRTLTNPDRTSVFVTSYRAGVATFPNGVEVPGSLGVLGNDLELVATNRFSMLVAPVENDGGTRLVAWKGGVGTWDGGWELLLDVPVPGGRVAAAANETEALVLWPTTTGLQGRQFPANTPVTIPLTGDVTTLSAGGIDGGFVVGWTEPSGTTKAVRVSSMLGPTFTLTGNTSSVQALTHPANEVVMTQTGVNAINLHRFMGTWSLSPFESGSFAAATGAQTVFFVAYQSPGLGGVAKAVSVSNFGQKTPASTTLIPFGTLPRLAGRDDADEALLMYRTGTDLVVRELSLTTAPVVSASTVTATPEARPLTTRASQWSPSVIWYDPLSRFLLVWDEETPATNIVKWSVIDPDEASSVLAGQVLGVTPTLAGANPELLRSPNGRQAIALREPGSRAIWSIQGLAKGSALTPQRAARYAALGEQTAMQWDSNGLTVTANFEGVPRIVQSGVSPRCAAVTNGSLWFLTDGSFAYRVRDTADGGTMTVPMNWGGLPPIGRPCAQATATNPPTIYAAGNTGGVIEVVSLQPASSPLTAVRLGTLGSTADALTVEPVIATVDGGALVAWASAGAGVSVALAAHSSLQSPVSLGGQDVSKVSIASSPAGDAVVAWDTFDPRLGVRRVEYRFLVSSRPDAGMDAGVPFDGGADAGAPFDAGPDAGVPFDAGADSGLPLSDGGVTAPDGGQPDASVVIDQDSGVLDQDSGVKNQDSGMTDGGADITFVPVCGCSQTDSQSVLLMLAALIMTWSRTRR